MIQEVAAESQLAGGRTTRSEPRRCRVESGPKILRPGVMGEAFKACCIWQRRNESSYATRYRQTLRRVALAATSSMKTTSGVYHVWVRCVRRAWLCGADPLTGHDWTHRKQWFFQRLEELAGIFAIDACVWAILSSHYHLIVRNRPDLASQWSDDEVARRWWMLYPERRDDRGRPLEPSELEIRSIIADPQRVAELRRRLCSVSWFMKSLNEWFAAAPMRRRTSVATSGKKDSVVATCSMKGRFWPAASTSI